METMTSPVIRNIALLSNPRIAQVYRVIIGGKWIRLDQVTCPMKVSNAVVKRYMTIICTRVLANAHMETRIVRRQGYKSMIPEYKLVIEPEDGAYL